MVWTGSDHGAPTVLTCASPGKRKLVPAGTGFHMHQEAEVKLNLPAEAYAEPAEAEALETAQASP